MNRREKQLSSMEQFESENRIPPEGEFVFISGSSEKDPAFKRLERNPNTKLFRLICIDPADPIGNYNSGWVDRDHILDEIHPQVGEMGKINQEESIATQFVCEKDPDEENN